MDTAPSPVPVYRALKILPLIPAVKTDSWNLSLRQHSSAPRHRQHTCRCTQRACNNCPKYDELQLWELGCLSTCALQNCWTCTNEVDHLINVLQLENLYGKRTKGICICATTEVSTTLSKEFDELQLWDLDCLLTARPITNVDHLVNELQLWNPHGHKDHGNQPLHHNRELSTNLMKCNCGTSTVFCRV